jgi:arylsulfatase
MKKKRFDSHPDGTPFDGSIGMTRPESTPSWPVAKTAPEGAPNVVFIVLDDLGYAQLGCYGGLGGRIQTPNIDRLAERGLRYRNFHTTSLCSPTRAALLTGRNHHSVGVGTIVERATGFPGYHARIPKDSAMVPAVLSDHGYATYCAGKWHLTPDEHNGPTGPFDRWPIGQGFNRFYGFLPGETDHWSPDLWEDNRRVDAPDVEGYHLTTDLADHAISWLSEHETIDDDRPFFLHFATGAPHAPHHVGPEWIEQYSGVFDAGWDVIHDETFELQLELGVVPQGTTLPPRNPGIRAWDSLSQTEQRVYARQMEVYAAFVTHTDHEIGRLLDHLDTMKRADDTLIVFLSDNGASAEGGQHGLSSEIIYFNGLTESLDEMESLLDVWGSPETYPHYANGWAWLGNTPNRWYKSMAHEGGTRDPLIVSWPSQNLEAGAVRDHFLHAVDVAATLYELLGIEPPSTFEGVEQRDLEGTSFASTLHDGDAPNGKTRQYFEMFAHRALWADGWKAVTLHHSQNAALRIGDPNFEIRMGDFDGDQWELYHLAEDFSEAHDLAEQYPDKLAELQAMWLEDAQKYNVLPLDDRVIARSLEPRPRVVQRKDQYSFRTPIRLTRATSPSVINRSHHIAATVAVPAGGGEGVIISNGGMQGGYSLWLAEGHVFYASNYLGRTHTLLQSAEPHPVGVAFDISLSWVKTGEFAGTATLFVDDHPVGEIHVPNSNPVLYAVGEGLEIGSDSGSAVHPSYTSPFPFTGTIHQVVLNTKGPEHVDPEAEDRIARYMQ